MKRLILICLLLALPFAAAAEAADGLRYEILDGAAVVTGYDGAAASLVIPDALGGFPVAAIGEEALAGLAADSVSLPRSLRSIRPGAFRGARMREVRFSFGLLEIGEEAFAGCENLLGAALPETLTRLAPGAFSGCPQLRYVTLPESVVIEEDPFPGCVRLASLPMVLDHPTLRLEGNRLVRREDGRVLSVLSAKDPEEGP